MRDTQTDRILAAAAAINQGDGDAAISLLEDAHEFATLSQHSPLSARRSRVLSTRLPNNVVAQVQRTAAAHGVPVSTFIARALAKLEKRATGPHDDPAGVVADIAALLGLEPDADPNEILRGISALLDELGDPNPSGDPLGGSPAPVPPAALSKAALATYAKRGVSLEVATIVEKRAAARAKRRK